MLVVCSGLLIALTSCSVENPTINTNIAGEAAGLYRGTLTLPSGEVLTAEEIEMHRVTDDQVSVESANQDNQRSAPFSDFPFQLMRSGAVIHHQLGTESKGTFVLDAAITPDELRIELPNGWSFDGVRIKNYFE